MNILNQLEETIEPTLNSKTIVWNGKITQFNLEKLIIEIHPTFFQVIVNENKVIAKVMTDTLHNLSFDQFYSIEQTIVIPYIDKELICNIHNSILTISNFEGNVYNLNEIVSSCLKILFLQEK